jgi:PAS domain S-box-containing protein
MTPQPPLPLNDVDAKRIAIEMRILHLCMDRAEVGITVTNDEGRILYANRLAHVWLGAGEEELRGRLLYEIDSTLDQNRWNEFTQRLRTVGMLVVPMNGWRSSGEDHTILVRVIHINPEGEHYYLFLARDTAEQKRTEDALADMQRTLRFFNENTLLGLYRTTPDGRILMVNPALVHMLGYDTADELLGRDLSKEGYTHSSERLEFQELMKREGQIIGNEAQWNKRDGSTIWVREGARAVRNEKGEIVYYDGTVEDITERKTAELQLRASLEEKETLLKEIHHRVKNNLQIISSLLNLQASEIKDPMLYEMFQESQNRIRSLALVHEKLYQARNFAQINFFDYLQTVTMHLARSYDRGGISWQIDGDEVHLGIDQAVPCGLIVNELISNAMKHAFVDRSEGSLHLALFKEANGDITIVVQDDGVGFPADKDFRQATSMGMVLIQSLVEQIDATIELDRGNGTKFTVRFHPR